jgi:hypothetical protein
MAVAGATELPHRDTLRTGLGLQALAALLTSLDRAVGAVLGAGAMTRAVGATAAERG